MALSVCVIVPARDAAEHLPAVLDALAAQQRAPDRVVVVDDGSRDATARIAAAHPVVDEVVAADGRGPGAARNAGAARAGTDVLAFTDADCAPDPEWLKAALAGFAIADLVQGTVAPPPGVPVGPWDRTIRVTHPHGLFETANLLVRRELFERLGGFEAWLAPRRGKELGEDVWLGYRATRAGARIGFVPGAVVHHAVIPRGPSGFVAERARLRFFPLMTARIPELRARLLYERWFLSRRSAAFDAALLGALLARRHRAAAVLALPYARLLAADGPRRAPVLLAADAVGFCALAAGSVRARTLVI